MNEYSPTWFETFLDTVPERQTAAEVSFLGRQLPLPEYERVLDLCCGAGRHALPLALAGYQVTGADLDETVLARAPTAHPDNPRYILLDMRELASLKGTFDAALVLWQSWGHFAPEENDAVIRDVTEKLRAGGRLVLDIYDRRFFERHQGTRTVERAGHRVIESKRMTGNRLTVTLEYAGGGRDVFAWDLFAPDEISEKLDATGLTVVTVCAGFDENRAADAAMPRFQAVFEKRG